MIHRKNTLKKLREERERYLGGDPATNSVVLDASLFEEAMQLVEAQDELIQRLGSSLRISRKHVRDLHKVIDNKSVQLRKKDDKIKDAEKSAEFFNTMAAERAIQRDDAVAVVKDLNDLLNSLNKFKANHPRLLMSISEIIKSNKEK